MLHAILRRHAPLKAKRNCLILACFFFIKKLFFFAFIYLFICDSWIYDISSRIILFSPQIISLSL